MTRHWCNNPECEREDHVIGYERARGNRLAFLATEDVRTLEECADELMRQGSAGHAVKLWALALRMRAALNLEPVR